MSEIDEMCRVCLKKSRGLKRFEEKMLKSLKVFECFENFTSIVIQENEIQSKICKYCFDKLKNACEFKEECLENDRKYKRFLAKEGVSAIAEKVDPFHSIQMVVIKQESLSDIEESIKEELKEIKTEKLEVDPVPVVYKKAATPKRKRKKKSYNNDACDKVRCRFCSRYFARKDIKTHTRRNHTDVFYCDLCPATTRRKEQIENHLFTVHVKVPPHECETCHKKFFLAKNMRAHIRSMHLLETGELVLKKPRIGPEFFECEYCGKSYPGDRKNAEYFCKRHEKTCTGKPENQIKSKKKKIIAYECKICNTKFETWKKRQRHILSKHTVIKKLICDLCGSGHKDKHRMRIHINKHLGIKDQICDICGKMFSSKIQMSHHRLTVHDTGERKFQCAHCDKKYHLKADLAGHVKSHKIIKESQCNVCGKFFRTDYSLAKHMEIHNMGTKFYNCKFCEQVFQRPYTLQQHINLAHKRAPKVLHCPVEGCKVTVNRNSTLLNHLKIHAGQKDHKCMYCEKTFFQKYHVTRHVISMHIKSTFGCKLCGFQMKVYKKFQKIYIDHVRDHHKELSQEQAQLLELEIRKLKFSDICPELPASLQQQSPITICDICSVNFPNIRELEIHKEKAHGIPNPNSSYIEMMNNGAGKVKFEDQ